MMEVALLLAKAAGSRLWFLFEEISGGEVAEIASFSTSAQAVRFCHLFLADDDDATVLSVELPQYIVDKIRKKEAGK